MIYHVDAYTMPSYWGDERHYTSMSVFADTEEEAKEKVRHHLRQRDGLISCISRCTVIDPSKIVDINIPWYPSDNPWWEDVELVAFDVETTGFSFQSDRITEIGFATYSKDERRFKKDASHIINDGIEIPQKLIEKKINDITNETLRGKPTFKEIAPDIKKYFKPGVVFVAHNRTFDTGHVMASLRRSGLEFYMPPVICSMEMAKKTKSVNTNNNKLETLFNYFYPEESVEQNHRAGDDAKQAGDVMIKLLRLNYDTIKTTKELMNYYDNPWR